jgi:hypothetical protein
LSGSTREIQRGRNERENKRENGRENKRENETGSKR